MAGPNVEKKKKTTGGNEKTTKTVKERVVGSVDHLAEFEDTIN